MLFALPEPAERSFDISREPGMAAELARGAITQRIRPSAPAQRRGDIDQGKRRHAEPALVGVVADAEIEHSHAILVQSGHGASDDQPAWRAFRPLLAGIAD